METDAQTFRDKILSRLPELATQAECPVPNRRFWDFYREQKSLFHDACLGVRKGEDGVWRIVAYPFEYPEVRRERQIKEMLSRHPLYCCDCGEPLAMIERSIMRDGREQFRYWCSVCRYRKGGALPHDLVDFLSKEQDFEIFDR